MRLLQHLFLPAVPPPSNSRPFFGRSSLFSGSLSSPVSGGCPSSYRSFATSSRNHLRSSEASLVGMFISLTVNRLVSTCPAMLSRFSPTTSTLQVKDCCCLRGRCRFETQLSALARGV